MRRAVAFLTCLGGPAVPDARTLSWFPVVGAALGLVVGGAWWGAEQLWPPAVAAALVVALDLALTGLLHLDGLVDSADGLLPQVRPDAAAGHHGGAGGRRLRRGHGGGRPAPALECPGGDGAEPAARGRRLVRGPHRDGDGRPRPAVRAHRRRPGRARCSAATGGPSASTG